MKVETADPEATVKAELIGGTGTTKVTLDEDRILILRIQDKQKQYVKFTTTDSETETTEVTEYKFHGLTLE